MYISIVDVDKENDRFLGCIVKCRFRSIYSTYLRNIVEDRAIEEKKK